MSDVTGRYVLKKPIKKVYRQADGTEREEEVRELVVREPTPRDLMVTDKHEGDTAKGIALAAHLTGLSFNDVADRMKPADFKGVMQIVEGFTDDGPPTGGTSSGA